MVTKEFEALGRACARGKGYPNIPFVVLPHPFETLPPDRVQSLAEERLQEIVKALTTPVEQPVARPA